MVRDNVISYLYSMTRKKINDSNSTMSNNYTHRQELYTKQLFN